ncbi:MAG: O-acetyl-ADP-ribose deacetylase [Planctomycetota bacterium]
MVHENRRSGAHDRIECALGDIVHERVDALVNAANARLAGGGGVDGAIHRAAGPELLAECRRLYPGGCPTGDACITSGFRLHARHVIHAVGPVWHGGARRERELLAHAYSRSLELCAQHRVRTVAFPAISAGAYGYPKDEAAHVALSTVAAELAGLPTIERVRFVLFDAIMLAEFVAALKQEKEKTR